MNRPPVFARSHPETAFKKSTKVSFITDSYFCGNSRQCELVVVQKLFGLVHPEFSQIAVKGLAGDLRKTCPRSWGRGKSCREVSQV
jgi:hypothetical protein